LQMVAKIGLNWWA